MKKITKLLKGSFLFKHYLRFILPSMLASTVTTISLSIDSAFAGLSLGTEGLAVISLSVPIISIDQILHCLLGSATTTLMLRYRGEGDKQKSNRYLGVILVFTLVLYLVVVVILILFYDPILHLLTNDQHLIDHSKWYLVPTILFMPILEICLCLERACLTDGRAKFFSCRSVVVAVFNILLDWIAVSILNWGVFGLAVATIFSALLGYSVTLTHLFSKKCTVSVSFKGLKNTQEIKEFLGATLRYGSNYVWSEVLQMLVQFIVTGAISSSGGTDYLAIWNCVSLLLNFIIRLQVGINSNTTLFIGFFSGQKDYQTCKNVLIISLICGFIVSLTIGTLVFIFSNSISALFSLTGYNHHGCSNCIKQTSICYPFLMFDYAILMFFPIINKNKIGYVLSFLLNSCIALFICIGSLKNIYFIVVGYVSATIIIFIICVILMSKDGNMFFPKQKKEIVLQLNIMADEKGISTVANDIENIDTNVIKNITKKRLCLLIEEYISYLAAISNNSKVLLRITKEQNQIKTHIIDIGAKHDIFSSDTHEDDSFTLEKSIYKKMPINTELDRIIEMNTLLIILYKIHD